MMPLLRGGLLGCGKISEFHLLGWSRIAEVEIAALADADAARADERRARFAPAARVYTGLAEMLARERLDFIDILTPPALHGEHCRAAARAGLHIICRSPLCTALEDARGLERELADYPRLFAVHENHPLRPWFREIAARHREGFFGDISLARFVLHNTGRGVLPEPAGHLVGMMRTLLGEPSRVYARLHRTGAAACGESLAHAIYEYPAATAIIEAGWNAAAGARSGVLVAGSRGEAFFEGSLARGGESRFRLASGAGVVLDERRSPSADYLESFYLLERQCADAMLGRTPPPGAAAAHVRTLAAVSAACQSAARGTPVEIPC